MSDGLWEVEVTETIVRKSIHFVTAETSAGAANKAVAESSWNKDRTEVKTREATSTPKLLT